jgi:hypothetical protein
MKSNQKRIVNEIDAIWAMDIIELLDKPEAVAKIIEWYQRNIAGYEARMKINKARMKTNKYQVPNLDDLPEVEKPPRQSRSPFRRDICK